MYKNVTAFMKLNANLHSVHCGLSCCKQIPFYFQFIVVSLRDGMYQNANVLFKTRFIDGVSTITRYVSPSPSTSR